MVSISHKTAGTVVSAGKMMKTVKVRMVKQEWNSYLRKYFTKPYHLLVHDPTQSLREGDVITMITHRVSKNVHHTVDRILAPFGTGLEERPPLLSAEERIEKFGEKEVVLQVAQKKAARREQWLKMEAWGRNQPDWIEKKTEHGRMVREDGGHEFGKINDEAQRGSLRARYRQAMALENEKQVERAQNLDGEALARESLRSA